MHKRILILAAAVFLLLTNLLVATADDAVDPHILPNFYDFTVPTLIKPSLSFALRDYPKPYLDHCHTQQNMSLNTANCTYANAKSKTTIVLFGDSHALSWFPAIEKLAKYKNWKLISLTMSSCWPADIPAWNPVIAQMMDNCTTWRSQTLDQIRRLKPQFIFVAGTSGFSTADENGNELEGPARDAAWRTGMKSTLNRLKNSTNKVFYLADYPASVSNPVECLKNHKSVKSCIKPLNKALSMDWLQTEHDVATESGAIFVDGTEWICQTDPCSPIFDNYLVYRDAGHLTATFAATLFSPLYKEIKHNLV